VQPSNTSIRECEDVLRQSDWDLEAASEASREGQTQAFCEKLERGTVVEDSET